MTRTAEKAELRRNILATRDAMPPTERAAAAATIAARAFPIAVPEGAIVSGFMPIGSEINPLPLMKKLAQAGAGLALPVVSGAGKPLVMRAWGYGGPLVTQVWGIKIPPPEAPAVDPDILIVPLAAFDRAGQRIGYGAGYYDRTIAALRTKKPVTTVGMAFAIQEIASVPAESFDEPLDFVMTEREVIRTGA